MRRRPAPLLGALAGAVVLGAALCAPAAARDACPAPSPTPLASFAPMDAATRTQLFDDVWSTIDGMYPDPGHNGVDWAAVRTEFEPRVAAATTTAEVYTVLAEMIARLDDGVSEFTPPAPSGAVTDTSVGMGLLVDGQAAPDDVAGLGVLYVYPDGPAERAGIQARDRILAVDGDPCPRVSIMRGPAGSTVDLLVSSPGTQARTVTVTRDRVTSTVMPEARLLAGPGRIGYLRLPAFWEPDAGANAISALGSLLTGGPLDGMVLDLRGVLGGDDRVIEAIAGSFLDGQVGWGRDRHETWPVLIQPSPVRARLADVPLVVLIDGRTNGASQVLAAVLHANGRAVTVGSPTPGKGSLYSTLVSSDGSTLTFLGGEDILPDGTIASDPLKPDVLAAADWFSETDEADSGIAAAIATLAAHTSP